MTERNDDVLSSKLMNRRALLLGSTAIAAASALADSACAQPAPGGRRPNILVIFGDDIGT